MTQPGYPHPAYPQPPRKRMSRTTGRLIAAGAVVAMCVVFPAVGLVVNALTAESGTTGSNAGESTAPADHHAWLPGASRAAYLSELGEIDPGLIVNEQRAIGRAENTCLDIRNDLSGDALADRVATRLSGGNATIDRAQAGQAIALMQKWICPHWGPWWASRHPSS